MHEVTKDLWFTSTSWINWKRGSYYVERIIIVFQEQAELEIV